MRSWIQWRHRSSAIPARPVTSPLQRGVACLIRQIVLELPPDPRPPLEGPQLYVVPNGMLLPVMSSQVTERAMLSEEEMRGCLTKGEYWNALHTSIRHVHDIQRHDRALDVHFAALPPALTGPPPPHEVAATGSGSSEP